MALMILASILFAWRTLKRGLPDPEAPKLTLEQPFSLRAALRFGLIFLALHVAGTLAQRYLLRLPYIIAAVLCIRRPFQATGKGAVQ
jgi:uncharacterized membrane protein (DUF4010 family)